MAKKKRKPSNDQSSSLLTIPTIPKGQTLVMDDEILPIVGLFGRSVELTYEKEFQLIDSMKVNQSAVFPHSKLYVITAIRTRIGKLSTKKFILKKINKEMHRIWRVADNTITRVGGRQKKSWYLQQKAKKASEAKTLEVNNKAN